MEQDQRRPRTDRLLRTWGYVFVFLLCGGIVFGVGRWLGLRPYLQITISQLEITEEGTVRVASTRKYSAPIEIAEVCFIDEKYVGRSSLFGNGEFSLLPVTEGFREKRYNVVEFGAHILRGNDEVAREARSVEAIITVGETYEVCPGKPLTVYRIRGKSGRVYERRIEVADHWSPPK
jgi:hypothetical protein